MVALLSNQFRFRFNLFIFCVGRLWEGCVADHKRTVPGTERIGRNMREASNNEWKWRIQHS